MISPEKNEEVLRKTGICFMHAQNYHSAMKYVAPVRKEIGIRNVFNLLGPLTNTNMNGLGFTVYNSMN